MCREFSPSRATTLARQVGLWVVSEYGESARLSAKDAVAAIVHRATQQRLQLELEEAALTALFKVVAKAGPHVGTAAAQLKPFIKPRLASRDIMVARLSHFISTAISCASNCSRRHNQSTCCLPAMLLPLLSLHRPLSLCCSCPSPAGAVMCSVEASACAALGCMGHA
eukprot:jgi/Ulvmu1/228/UM001_0232.1